MLRILIASSISSDAIEALRQQHDVICAFGASEETLKELIVDREVLIFRSGVQITADVMAQAPDLRLILRAGSGYDNIDLNYVLQQEIRFIRIPGPGAQAVAEMSFALMLALARNVLIADREWRQGHWVKQQMKGHLLTGKVLGIIGAGNIGRCTGALGVAWGMDVIGCVEHPLPETLANLQATGIEPVTCSEVLSQADFVSIHVPLKDSTRNMIDAPELAQMKRGSFLINLARGGVVNEHAVYDALTSGHLAGAALDVHAREGEGNISPLAELDNVILTPHIGASTLDSQRKIGQIILSYVAEADAQTPAEMQAAEKMVIV
jgi:phosphoglycerate dehydrogenase-like enzyme